jgi:hypothetical protein
MIPLPPQPLTPTPLPQPQPQQQPQPQSQPQQQEQPPSAPAPAPQSYPEPATTAAKEATKEEEREQRQAATNPTAHTMATPEKTIAAPAPAPEGRTAPEVCASPDPHEVATVPTAEEVPASAAAPEAPLASEDRKAVKTIKTTTVGSTHKQRNSRKPREKGRKQDQRIKERFDLFREITERRKTQALARAECELDAGDSLGSPDISPLKEAKSEDPPPRKKSDSKLGSQSKPKLQRSLECDPPTSKKKQASRRFNQSMVIQRMNMIRGQGPIQSGKKINMMIEDKGTWVSDVARYRSNLRAHLQLRPCYRLDLYRRRRDDQGAEPRPQQQSQD